MGRTTARLSTKYSKHRPNGVIIERNSLSVDLFNFPFSQKDIEIGKRSDIKTEESPSPRVIK